MAIFDVYGELSDAQALTTQGTVASTDCVYLTQSDKTFGVASGNLYLNIKCNTTFTSLGAATLTIALVYDTDGTLTAGSTVLYQTPALALSSAALTAFNGKGNGSILCMPLPDMVDQEAYIGLLYTVATADFTAGAIDAWIGPPMESLYNTQTAASNV